VPWTIEDKTCMVTGANIGIGKPTAMELARRGARMILAGRSAERTAPVADEIRSAGGDARFLRLDLSSLTGVRAAADEFMAWNEPLHVLINNAGVARHRAVTEDGFEHTFGVNYLGPYLFTRLLLPTLEASSPSRIVNVASDVHRSVTMIDWDRLHRSGSWVGFQEYKVSKLGNVLFTRELARRLAGSGVRVVAVHPGLVATQILRDVPAWVRLFAHRDAQTPEEGARTSIFCATAPEVVDGGYYAKEHLRDPGPGALDDDLAAALWERSEEWVGPFLTAPNS
jgi:retinol dehydrogenase-12